MCFRVLMSMGLEASVWYVKCVHPVSVTRLPSLRTQTLESLSHYLWTNGFLSNPDPGENLVRGNLVMETGCIWAWGMVEKTLGFQVDVGFPGLIKFLVISNVGWSERLAEYCWNSTVWNLDFDENIPLCTEFGRTPAPLELWERVIIDRDLRCIMW